MEEVVLDAEKVCRKCLLLKPLTEYYTSKASKDGFAYWCKPCCRKIRNEYYVSHREIEQIKSILWAKLNPEKACAKSKRWNRAHPDRQHHVLKQAFQSAEISAVLLEAKAKYWGDLCWICRGSWTEWDHVKPLSKGGSHLLCNLRPICRSCNARKRDRWPV